MLGRKIKFIRLEKKIKQSNLAKGICSVSYLSKIENEQTTPSTQIVTLLCERLNIPNLTITEENIYSERDTVLYELYKRVTFKDDSSIILGNYKKFCKNYSENEKVNTENFFLNEIYLQRIKIALDLEYKELNIMEEELTKKELFVYRVNKMLIYYFSEDYQKALGEMRLNFRVFNEIDIKEAEKMDFLTISISILLKNEIYSEIFFYIHKVIDYYLNNFIFNKVIDLYIILGIIYKNLKEFKKAEEQYNKCDALLVKINNIPSYDSLILHNKGSLYLEMEKYDLCIEYYKKSLKIKKKKYDYSFFISLMALIDAYSKINDIKNLERYYKYGLDLLETAIISEKSKKKIYFYLNIYFSKFVDNNGNSEYLQLLKEGIEFSKDTNDIISEKKYLSFLSDYYIYTKRFKEATKILYRLLDLYK